MSAEDTQNTSAERFERLVERDTTPGRSGRETFGAALALLALLVGLPVALLVLSGPPPVPHGLPGMRELAQQLSAEDVVSVLVAVVWLSWLFFVVCVALEVVAARRGGLATRVPLGGPFQRLARVLIGALLLSGIVAGPAQAAAPVEAPVQAPSTSVGLSQASMDAQIQQLDDLVDERAEAAAAEATADEAGHLSYTVKAPVDGYHDNLWDIADRHLGDGRRYTEIYELNKDREQPDGRHLELARLIQPGWELVMPDDATGLERVAPAPAPVEAPSTPAPDTTVAADDVAADQGVFDAVGDWPAGSGVLAATVLGALLLVRRRRVGRRPDDDARAIEADLRVAATVDRIDLLDAALRRLAAACRRAGVVPPAVYAVQLDDDSVELLLSPGAPVGVEGWSVHDEGRRWRAERADLDLESSVTDAVPYPALVSLGVDVEGRDVLVDLESAGGIVAIGGSLPVAEQVASSLAIQAATAPWADAVRVTASALPVGIADIEVERLQVVDDLGPELAPLAEHVAALPEDVLQGRVGRRAAASSRLVVSGDVPPVDVADRLGQLAGGGARSLSVVVVGDHAAARWRIRVDDQGNLELPQLGLTVTANRLGAEQVESVADLFVSGREPDPDTDRPKLPAIARDVDDAAWATAPRRVAVLGRVVVQGVDAEVPRIDQSTEIVAYLALHPEGVHPNLVSAAVWPRGVTSDVLEAAIGRARDWLGTDVDGTHLLREDAEGRLSLADAVVCDWHAVVSLLHQARKSARLAGETDLLRRALMFVRGEPFDRVPRGRYAWVARDDVPRTAARVVIDAAERLIQILGGDPGGAAQAAESGLLVAPGHQPLWRSLLRARFETEGVPGVHRTLEEMGQALSGLPLDAETEALIDELLPPTPEVAHA